MSRFFNTEGPCRPERHYMLPPEARAGGIRRLVEQERYFILHAPRQTGKTTTLLALLDELRGQGVIALRASLLTSRGTPAVEAAEPLWLTAIEDAADSLPMSERPPDHRRFLDRAPGSRLQGWLSAWAQAVTRPIVLVLDEADSVQGEAMLSLLAQLRNGYEIRGPGRFPVSIALVGLRNLRDYVTGERGRSLTPGSPFNVITSVTLRNFTRDEVAALYGQHSADTGQVFEREAVDAAFTWTEGQPYLVCALAAVATEELVPDRARPVTALDIERARERLIRDRVTHLDNLAERIKEERVARVLTPILLGAPTYTVDTGSDDFRYCVDLGLVRAQPEIGISNPWYREVLLRALGEARQVDAPTRSWVREGRLDVAGLIDAFLEWWPQHAEVLRERDQSPYREAVPHIVFLAFLQRVVNGGGSVQREFALGRGRVDVLVSYGAERHVIELKRVTSRDALERVLEDAARQTTDYAAPLGLREAWILVFDERDRPWRERLWREERERDGLRLHLRGA